MRKSPTYKMLVGCVLLPLCCAAVEPYIPLPADPILEPWRWQHVEYLDGAGVLCMDEVQDGTLWFGAVGGLVRDDGRKVIHIPFDEGLLNRIAKQRPEPWASAVLALGHEDLLLVAGRSLVRWREGQWTVLIKELEPVNFDVRLFQGEDESIWLQTYHTLWKINNDLTGGKLAVQVPDGCRLSACAGSKGDLWFIQSYNHRGDDLVHVPVEDGEVSPQTEWETFPVADSFGLRNISLLAGRDGRIWFADAGVDHGIRSFDITEKTWHIAASVPHSNSHYSLLESRDGTIWAGGAGEIFSLGPRGPSIYLPYQLGLPVVPLYLFESSAGKIWVLTQFGRIYNVDTGSRQWQTYPRLHFQCETEDGRIQWFLTRNNQVVSHDQDLGRWLQYEVSDGMIGWPRALVSSSQGLIWAAGSHGGAAAIAVFDGKQWKRFRHPEFAETIAPRAVFEAMDGTMWFGTTKYLKPIPSGGALQYRVSADGDIGLLEHHAPPVFPKKEISVFAQQDEDSLWLGDVGTDCYHLSDRRMEPITALPWRIMDDMVVDSAGVLWVAKGGFGVYRKEGDRWIQYSTEDGLVSSLVSDLLPLRDGTLLAASGGGISRFDGRHWTTYALPPTITMARDSGTMHQAQDGALWLNFGQRDWQLRTRAPTASLGEHTKFCSVRYVFDTAPPDTRITYFLKKVTQPGNSQMAWLGRDLWDNTPKDFLEYSWRLDDGEWSPYSRETDRMFLEIPHGKHALEVRARDRNFNVDPTPARADFLVAAQLWMRPWFIAMVLAFICGVIAFIWMLIYFHDKQLKDRQQHLVEMDRLKTGFFTNISHELNTPLMLVTGPLERILASEGDAEKKTLLSMALRNVNRIANLVTQLLDFRKLEEGKMKLELIEGDAVPLLQEVIELLHPLAAMHQVECRLEGATECQGWLDPEKLTKIAHNLVSNAIKYTPAGGRVRVVLDTVLDEDRLKMLSLAVEDTGRGISPEHFQHIFERFYRIPEKSIVDGSGIGLNLTKELVELWGGEIRAESPICEDEKRPGTCFSVVLPIEREGLSKQGISYAE